MVKRSAADDNTGRSRAVSRLLAWYALSARDLPWRCRSSPPPIPPPIPPFTIHQPPTTNLDPYGVWISEVMLQQTRVAVVIPYWERWMRVLPTPSALAAATEDQILKLWEGLGYYSRARNLRRAAEIIMLRHQGRFPSDLAEVRALPGVGDYTAGAVCSIAYNQPTPAVDGNVIRVLTRALGIAGDPRLGPTREKIWAAAGDWMQAARRKRGTPSACSTLTQALMELGATVCLPRNPDCPACPLRQDCFARREGRTSEFPQTAARGEAVPRHFMVLVVECGSRVLARQRPAGVVNGGLWEFPNFELAVGDTTALAAILGEFARFNPRPLTRLAHSITKYRITLEVYQGKASSEREAAFLKAIWLGRKEIARRAFTGAHRKIARLLA
jgi:A/G-specific adenine glycosylase